jgi:hypothetical protein
MSEKGVNIFDMFDKGENRNLPGLGFFWKKFFPVFSFFRQVGWTVPVLNRGK